MAVRLYSVLYWGVFGRVPVRAGRDRDEDKRGILRTFVLALREAQKWDRCALIAANIALAMSCLGLDGGQDLADEVVERINELLAGVSENLVLS